MSDRTPPQMGLAGATGVGVGAIVGGGILALAGVAFATTGPAALAAFALNGVVAVITALSFAELSSRFPESGGTYTFAKKVLSVEAAFAVGWIVWFASIVAAVLYAIGFAAFALPAASQIWALLGGDAPAWLDGRGPRAVVACLATLAYALLLCRSQGGGGPWINVGKLLVFTVLIAGGLWAFAGSPAGTLKETFVPFLPDGTVGLVRAMGFTFIALQGFDLIAAVAGEVRSPAKVIPRAMLLSLAIALVIYMPLLFVVATVGPEAGATIQSASTADPETIVALAAGRFLGGFGYWLVVVAALLSMLSALQANLYAASRVALAMARDRTLPSLLERLHATRETPITAIAATALIVAMIAAVLPDVAGAGAAASLIFLVTFALAQLINVLARYRVPARGDVFRTPFFPVLPLAGALVCIGLALFQAIAVPAAGRIAGAWLGVGGILFLSIFAPRARVRDAASEAIDPHLLRLRGRTPLVLVPIANPAHAHAMVEIASALAAPGVGRCLLLNVLPRDRTSAGDHLDATLADAQIALRRALLTSLGADARAEALMTVADDVWAEISRVARAHDCESVLLGLSELEGHVAGGPIERLLGSIDRDTVVLRAPDGFQLERVRRILVPVGGRGHHDILRARLIASLARGKDHEITYLRIVAPGETRDRRARAKREAHRLVLDEARGRARAEVVESDSVIETVTTFAAESDLVILGLQRHGRRRRVFGDLATQIARETECAIVMISHRG